MAYPENEPSLFKTMMLFLAMSALTFAYVYELYEDVRIFVRRVYNRYQTRVPRRTVNALRACYARLSATRAGMQMPVVDTETAIERAALMRALDAARATFARGSLPTSKQLKVLCRKPVDLESTNHELMARYSEEIKALVVIAEHHIQTRRALQNPK